MTVAIYTHPAFQQHDPGAGHPESAWRLDAALDGVTRAGAAREVEGSPSPFAETDRLIAKVHSADYERDLAEAWGAGRAFFHAFDNPLSPGTFAAARTAADVALAAAEAVWTERLHDRAFVIARPPGHHAERSRAMGFCFFNTIAIVAERLRELPGIDRVFIVDWDVHHGNGTQHIFESRDDVYYASIHRFPFYPGTGAPDEIGRGRGRGATLNIPLPGDTGDAAYLAAFDEVILPAIDGYRPDALLISAGFDAHARDPLGGMRVTGEAFGAMTARMIDAAERHCGGRLLSLLEGGYDREGLAESVAEHVVALRAPSS